VQIGTFALRTRAITTVEIPYSYKAPASSSSERKYVSGALTRLFATLLANYLHLRLKGYQYEAATETAISLTLNSFPPFLRPLIQEELFRNLKGTMREVCRNAPMPPESAVSLISRGMVVRRWESWGTEGVVGKRVWWGGKMKKCWRVVRGGKGKERGSKREKDRWDGLGLLSGFGDALQRGEERTEKGNSKSRRFSILRL